MKKAILILSIIAFAVGCKEEQKQVQQVQEEPQVKLSDKELRELYKDEINKFHHRELIEKYKEKFNREIPDWKWEDKVSFAFEAAVEMNMPFHTKEEEAALKDNLQEIKEMYQEKFGEPITDDELLTTRVYYSSFAYGGCYNTDDLIIRNADGAFLISKFCDKHREAQLTVGEWLDFIRDLYKCRIDEWKKYYEPEGYWADGDSWKVHVFSLDAEPKIFSGQNEYPPSWDEFNKAVDKILMKKFKR